MINDSESLDRWMAEELRQMEMARVGAWTVLHKVHQRLDRERPARGSRGRPAFTVLPAAAAGVAVALILVNAALAHLVSSYAVTLSRVPLVGAISTPIMRLAGLSGAEVTRGAGSATSAGHTLTLIGASADPARTVVLVDVDGLAGFPSKFASGFQVDSILTDQYGHAYSRIGGEEGNLWFQPLVGRAAHGAVRLVLHVSRMDVWPATTPSTYPTTKVVQVSGDWNLSLTVTRHPGAGIPLPAPIRAGDITYAVTSIQVSGTEITFHWMASGGKEIPALLRAWRARDIGTPGSAGRLLDVRYFSAYLKNADGSSVAQVPGSPGGAGYTIDSPDVITGTAQQVLARPGKYAIVIGDPAQVRFPIVIP